LPTERYIGAASPSAETSAVVSSLRRVSRRHACRGGGGGSGGGGAPNVRNDVQRGVSGVAVVAAALLCRRRGSTW